MYVTSTLWLADTDSCIEIQKALRFLGLWRACVCRRRCVEIFGYWSHRDLYLVNYGANPIVN